MRTRATTAVGNDTARNESVALAPATFGAKNVPRLAFETSKNWIDVVLARSTSVKTAPNPLTVAGVVVPGTKKLTSTTLLPSAVNSRCGEKAANVAVYEKSMLPNSIGVAVPVFALTWRPVPGVLK